VALPRRLSARRDKTSSHLKGVAIINERSPLPIGVSWWEVRIHKIGTHPTCGLIEFATMGVCWDMDIHTECDGHVHKVSVLVAGAVCRRQAQAEGVTKRPKVTDKLHHSTTGFRACFLYSWPNRQGNAVGLCLPPTTTNIWVDSTSAPETLSQASRKATMEAHLPFATPAIQPTTSRCDLPELKILFHVQGSIDMKFPAA
jgi:hypothetical protein